MTIPIRHFDNGADVLANAKRVRDVFFRPRQIAPTQLEAAPEEAAEVAPVTPKPAVPFRPAATRTPRQIVDQIVRDVVLAYCVDREDIFHARSQNQARKVAIASVAKALPHWPRARICAYFGVDKETVRRIVKTVEPIDVADIISDLESAANATLLVAKFREVHLRRGGVAKDLTIRDIPAGMSMRAIMAEVVSEFQVSQRDLMSDRRSAAIVYPRFALMWLLQRYTPASLPAIGRFLGGKDHTTVLNGCRRCEVLMEDDPAFGAKVEAISRRMEVLA